MYFFAAFLDVPKKEEPLSSKSIEKIKLSQTISDHIYTIYVDNETVGTNNIKITTGVLKTFNEFQYSHVVEIKETVSLYGQTGEIRTYAKENSDGYVYLSEDDNHLKKYIPFPLKTNASLYGPFCSITSQHIEVFIHEIHDSYINKNGHIFSNVIEARNKDDTIRIFINNDFFIIQKEDYRYLPTIQSLKI